MWSIIDKTGDVEQAYNGKPLSFDSTSAPKTINIADFEGKVESNSYSYAIQVIEASVSTIIGLAEFLVKV